MHITFQHKNTVRNDALLKANPAREEKLRTPKVGNDAHRINARTVFDKNTFRSLSRLLNCGQRVHTFTASGETQNSRRLRTAASYARSKGNHVTKTKREQLPPQGGER